MKMLYTGIMFMMFWCAEIIGFKEGLLNFGTKIPVTYNPFEAVTPVQNKTFYCHTKSADLGCQVQRQDNEYERETCNLGVFQAIDEQSCARDCTAKYFKNITTGDLTYFTSDWDPDTIQETDSLKVEVVGLVGATQNLNGRKGVVVGNTATDPQQKGRVGVQFLDASTGNPGGGETRISPQNLRSIIYHPDLLYIPLACDDGLWRCQYSDGGNIGTQVYRSTNKVGCLRQCNIDWFMKETRTCELDKQMVISDCPPAYEPDRSDIGACQACGKDKFKSGFGNTACAQCPNMHMPNDDQTECVSHCPVGQEYDENLGKCRLCHPGYFKAAEENDACTECPDVEDVANGITYKQHSNRRRTGCAPCLEFWESDENNLEGGCKPKPAKWCKVEVQWNSSRPWCGENAIDMGKSDSGGADYDENTCRARCAMEVGCTHSAMGVVNGEAHCLGAKMCGSGGAMANFEITNYFHTWELDRHGVGAEGCEEPTIPVKVKIGTEENCHLHTPVCTAECGKVNQEVHIPVEYTECTVTPGAIECEPNDGDCLG